MSQRSINEHVMLTEQRKFVTAQDGTTFKTKTANKVGYGRHVLQHTTDARLTTHRTGKADAYPHMAFVYLLKFTLENCATKKRNTKILHV